MNFASIFLVVAALCCFGDANNLPRKFCSTEQCINGGNVNLTSVILCNRCMVKLLTRSDKAEQFYKFQRKVINDDGKTLFTDLNEDVLYHIVDELELGDIINLLKAFPGKELSRVSTSIFHRKYKHLTIEVGAEPGSITLGSTETIKIESNTLKNHHIETSKGLLENFGGLIERLEVYGNRWAAKRDRPFSILSQLIQDYTSKSLKYLDLGYLTGETFEFFNRTFEEVEELKFITVVDEAIIKPGNSPLNELFPKLQRLEVDCSKHMDYSWLFNEFPHLVHLKLMIRYNEIRKEELIFEGILSKNTQVKSIETNKLSNYLYSFIQKYQLKLEHLNVVQFHVKGVRFDHLKSLVVTYMDPEEADQLSTPLLESLEIRYNPQIVADWVPFLRKHRNVKRLAIHNFAADGCDKIMQLINLLPNLTQIKIDHSDNYMIPTYALISETLNEIITTSQNLEKFNFMTEPVLTESELNTIRERYQNDWKLVVEGFQRENKDLINFSFEKKNLD